MSAQARGTLKIRLFGPFELLVDGAPLPGLSEHRKGDRLLAHLCLYPNKVLENEWVATQLWPETGSIDSLKHTVSGVRNALGAHGARLIARSGTLSLDLAGADVDVTAFANAWHSPGSGLAGLEGAVELYTGPLLQDWYDDWVEAARDRYAAKYIEALQSLADHAIGSGDFQAARRYLRRLVMAGDPAGSLHGRLMAVLVSSRNHVDAKPFYEQYRDQMRRDHGLLLPRGMMELYEQIPRTPQEFVPEFEPSLMELEPVGGAVPLVSKFYLERPADAVFHTAIARRDCIVLLEGPRQIGKTSLLARGLEQARQAGARVVVTDFQKLSLGETQTVESFFQCLARWIYRRLAPPVAPEEGWDSMLSPGANFEGYLRDEILAKSAVPVVWGIDEADRIFDSDYRSSVFGLFRSWYNERSLEPSGPWHRLTLVMTYSTEAHLFISNLNQSPFNVGTKVSLRDFAREQVAELNRRYDSPLNGEADTARLVDLVGGHPYLVRRSLHEMKARGLDLDSLEAEADREDGLFGDHLDRMRMAVTVDPDLTSALRAILRGEPCPARASFSRLRSAGVLAGESLNEAHLRCRLYDCFLRRHLL